MVTIIEKKKKLKKNYYSICIRPPSEWPSESPSCRGGHNSTERSWSLEKLRDAKPVVTVMNLSPKRWVCQSALAITPSLVTLQNGRHFLVKSTIGTWALLVVLMTVQASPRRACHPNDLRLTLFSFKPVRTSRGTGPRADDSIASCRSCPRRIDLAAQNDRR
jgi:hypothetical protein